MCFGQPFYLAAILDFGTKNDLALNLDVFSIQRATYVPIFYQLIQILKNCVVFFHQSAALYHLYRNLFLAQTRIRSQLGYIFLFRNSFQYPLSETRFETPFSSCCVYHRSLSIASKGREIGFVTAELHCAISSETQLCVYYLYRIVFLAQTRIRSPFFRVSERRF